MKFFFLVGLLFSSVSIFAFQDDPIDVFDLFTSNNTTHYCGRKQKREFRSFLEDKKTELKRKMDLSTGPCNEVNFPSHVVITTIESIDGTTKLLQIGKKQTEKRKFIEVCDRYFSYCNGESQYSMPEFFGEDVEVFDPQETLGDKVTVALTMNRDECKKYFGLDKPVKN